ncbi:peroxiredoxin [Isoalcanivorax indicus]|uniref:peroxiredoxin n=1 Tax=Isoalcanivorax indicus TaxID=2202653 RepID=UPI000DB9FC88|nr:peroxiredoxin [Isoalcanivorax indicus]
MSKTAQLDKTIPAFTAAATSGQTVRSRDFKGHKVVLYFYPKDNTPGCTTEGSDFRDLHSDFENAGCLVYGVSKDSLRSHENFRNKLGLPFELISDEDETLCRLFDVIKLKKMYGREFEGIERSTFLIDADSTLRREWRKVKVKGHAEDVLEAARAL